MRAYWPNEVIDLLKGGEVQELSLDHDLGDNVRGTSYDVILWIEEAVALHGFIPPKISVHSANTSARGKMQAGIRSIEALAKARRRDYGLLHLGMGTGNLRTRSNTSLSHMVSDVQRFKRGFSFKANHRRIANIS